MASEGHMGKKVKKKGRKPQVSIVFVVHNEAKIIEKVIRGYYNEINPKLPCRIVVAEDGSTDGTKEILKRLEKELPMTLIMGETKKGFKQASIDALRAAKTALVFYSDADGQHLPKDFWKLYRHIGHYDIVVGRKMVRRDPFHRNFLAWGFNAVVRSFFKLLFFDIDSGFRLIKKEVIDAVLDDVKYLDYGFTAEFAIRAYYEGFEIKEVPVRHNPRRYGVTGMFPMRKLPFIVTKQIRDLLKLRREVLLEK